MNLRFLIIAVLTFLNHNAFAFEKFNLNDIDPYENIIVEDMFEPLKVTGDALPWQLFRETKEIEDCRPEIFNPGNKVDCMIIDLDVASRKASLSIKELEERKK